MTLLSTPLDAAQRDLVASIRACVSRSGAHGPLATFDAQRWRDVADVGVLGIGWAGLGSLDDLAVAVMELGRLGVHGPYAATVVARQLLDEAEAAAVVDGASLATATTRGLVPWGPHASLILDTGPAPAVVEAAADPVEITSMAGERWWRVPTGEVRRLQPSADADLAARLVVAAWVIGASASALEDVVAYSRERRQFGRPVFEFQAVAHALAAAAASVLAGVAGVRRVALVAATSGAAEALDLAERTLVAARRAAREAMSVAHQVYGAVAFVAEGPLGTTAMRVEECCTLPPTAGETGRAIAARLLDGPTIRSQEP